MTAPIISIVLGAWLFASAFLLPHGASGWNSILVGLAVCAVGMLEYSAPGRPGIRYANTALAAWLLVTGFVLPHESAATVLHDLALALVLLLMSLVPPQASPTHALEGGGAAPPPR